VIFVLELFLEWRRASIGEGKEASKGRRRKAMEREDRTRKVGSIIFSGNTYK